MLGGRFAALLADELNVKEVRVAGENLAELRTLLLKPSFRVLGPKLGPRLNAAKQALAALPAAAIEQLLHDGRLELRLGDAQVEFTTAKIEVVVQGRPGYGVETDGRTLVAFDTGLAAGADGIELDVRLSLDGVAVIMHDPTVDRTTDATGPVDARTAVELRARRGLPLRGRRRFDGVSA